MSARRCATCDVPIQDQIIICRRCEQECRQRLHDQAAHLGELQIELRRETRKHELLKAAGLQWRIPFNDQASELIRRQSTLLGGWTATVVRMQPPIGGPCCAVICGHASCKLVRERRPPAASVPARSIWLASKVRSIHSRVEVRLLLEALRKLDAASITLIDLPANRSTVYCGPCPNLWPVDGSVDYCPGEIDAHFPLDLEAECYMICRACQERWPSFQWNRTGTRILGRAAQLEQQAALAKMIGGAA